MKLNNPSNKATHIPLAQKAAGVLALLALEHNVEAVLPVVDAAAIELAVRVVEDVGAAHVHRQVVAADRVLQLVELVAEEAALDVEVEDVGVVAREVDEHRVGLVAQLVGRLAQDVVEDDAVRERELEEAARVLARLAAHAAQDGGDLVLLRPRRRVRRRRRRLRVRVQVGELGFARLLLFLSRFLLVLGVVGVRVLGVKRIESLG